MKKTVRRAIPLLCLFLLLQAFASCGNEAEDRDPTAAQTNAGTAGPVSGPSTPLETGSAPAESADPTPEGETLTSGTAEAGTGSPDSLQTDVADINDLSGGWTSGWH